MVAGVAMITEEDNKLLLSDNKLLHCEPGRSLCNVNNQLERIITTVQYVTKVHVFIVITFSLKVT